MKTLPIRALAVAGATLLSPALPAAQEPGDSVRVSAPARGLTGEGMRVLAVRGDTLLLAGRWDDTAALAWAEIATLRVRRPHRPDPRAARAGALVGTIIGGALGILSQRRYDPAHEGAGPWRQTAGRVIPASAALGAGIGYGYGAGGDDCGAFWIPVFAAGGVLPGALVGSAVAAATVDYGWEEVRRPARVSLVIRF